MKLNRVLCIVLAAVICMGMLAGCGKGKDEEVGEVKPYETMSYPLETGESLTYWMMGGVPVMGYTDRSEYPFSKAYEERLGVKIDWKFPTVGQEKQQLGLLLASDNRPDIIEYYWYDIPGGPQKALDDLTIAELTPLIDKYSPNFKKYLAEHPDMDKQAKTDSGKYYYYPGFAQYGGDNDVTLVTAGYMIRKDWLDELNLPIPETISEWYTTLKAFKELKGADTPLILEQKNRAELSRGGIAGAWGLNVSQKDFYVEDGIVKYGRAQAAYKDFLTEMNKWYNEGLIDRNIATVETKQIDAAVINGKAGMLFGWIGSDMGKWLAALSEKDPGATLIGVPFPVMNKGEVSKFGMKDKPIYFGGAAISHDSKKKELAAKVLDFGYSPEGHDFMNFGVEGVSYNMIDGYPKYSNLIMNNPDGNSVADMMKLHIRATLRGPFVQDKRYIEQYYALPAQKETQKIWMTNRAETTQIPQITLTAEEQEEYTRIMADVEKFTEEKMLKFITNVDSLDTFDSYLEQLKSMKLDRAIELKQIALDRYNKR